jgi:YHS domain-containing protein
MSVKRHVVLNKEFIRTVDPVCGMTVDANAAKPEFEHEGVVYRFCSIGCEKKFSADPVAYLSADGRLYLPHVSGGLERDAGGLSRLWHGA